MHDHTRAMAVASAHAAIVGRKVAGLYDHMAGRHLRIAAECRGGHLQGFDGDRAVRFGGSLPQLYDCGDRAYVALEVTGDRARGFDHRSQTAFVLEVADVIVQLFDHGRGEWSAFDVQTA